MTVEIEEMNGITARVRWTCARCGHRQRHTVALGNPRTVICHRCRYTDTLILDEHVGAEAY